MTPDTKALSELVERVRGFQEQAESDARFMPTVEARDFCAGRASAFKEVAALLSSLSPELAGTNDHD